jgi:hypothetical protein
MARLDIERQHKILPKRMQYAIEQIEKLGYVIHFKDDTRISFMFKEKQVTLFPYSGWHTGKSIKDGRGIDLLLKQLKT